MCGTHADASALPAIRCATRLTYSPILAVLLKTWVLLKPIAIDLEIDSDEEALIVDEGGGIHRGTGLGKDE